MGTKSYLRGVDFFNLSNIFFHGGEKFSKGGFDSRPLSYGPGESTFYIVNCLKSFDFQLFVSTHSGC